MNTDPQRWERLKALFDRAVEMPAEERKEFLSELKIDERTLFDELYELIAVDEAAAAALDETDGGDEAASLIGTSIGSYRIVRELGRGGMGTVFEGLREDGDFEKRVAIKLTGRSIFSDDLIRRFRNEKQILARLEHPNIVRLLDGGITATHVPYYVMEFVDGMPITRFAAANSLDTRSRLELFLKVTDAVAYAHRQLVVHRDLKPSNILVTPEGSVKLLDFGIAKGLEDEHQTLTMGVPLTPDYASPEQIKGDAVSTGSDVYSLGVLLFELLTGLDPAAIYGERKQYFHQAVLDTDPVRPSEAVTRHRRNKGETAGDGSRELARGLAGDLDNIILHCLEKAPESRYPTVDGLAADIRAFLEGMPVAAHPQSRAYRWRKYARRNAMPLAAASAALLLIFAGSGAAVYQSTVAREQQQLAEARFQQVRKVANALIFDYHDEIAKLEGSLALREKLISDAVDYLDAISAADVTDTTLLYDLGVAYRKIGDVQGLNYVSNMGNIEAALINYQKSVNTFAKLIELDPEHPEAVSRYADAARGHAGALTNSGKRADAQLIIQQAITVLSKKENDLSHSGLITLNRLRIAVAVDDPSNEVRYRKLSALVPHLDKMELRFPDKVPNNSVRAILESRLGNAARFSAFDLESQGQTDQSRYLYKQSIVHYESMIGLIRDVEKENAGGKLVSDAEFSYLSGVASSYAGLGDIERATSALFQARSLLNVRLSDTNDKAARLKKLALDRIEQTIWLKQRRTTDALRSIENAKVEIANLHASDPENMEKVYYGLHFCQQAARLYDPQRDQHRIRENQSQLEKYSRILVEKYGQDATLKAYF